VNCLIGKREVLNIPLFGQLCDPQWNILVGRDTRDSKVDRDQVIRDIEARQIDAEKGLKTPIFILPEGATTNGKSVIRFKRGAFASLRAVRPSYAKISSFSGVTACHGDPTSLVAYLYLLMLTGTWTYARYDMPVFEPNEYFW
jgi:Acyltransferase